MDVRELQANSGPRSATKPVRVLATQGKHFPVLLLALFAASLYANTLGNGFVWDDTIQVLNNPYVQSPRYINQILTSNVWSYLGTEGETNYYRPVMTLGYLLCYQLFGPAPLAFHLVSVLLHTFVVCLLFLVSLALTSDRSLALVAAVAFALHPVHTESVAWIAAITDIELTFFYLLSFWLYLNLSSPRTRRLALIFYLTMLVSFALALLSKEQAVTLPLMAAIYEHFCSDDRRQTRLAQKVSRYGGLWLLAAAYVLFRMHVLGGFAPAMHRTELSDYESLLHGIGFFGQYLWKAVWPVSLQAFYVFYSAISLGDARVLVGVGGLISMVCLLVLSRGQKQIASFGVLWFLVTLSPVLNPRWAPGVAERYLYLPSVGFSWVVAWAGVRLWAATRKRAVPWHLVLAAGTGILVLLCAYRIVQRNRDWKDEETLFRRTLASDPNAIPIRVLLARMYRDQGKLYAAELQLQEALKLDPNQLAALGELGALYAVQGRQADAVGVLQRVIRQEPKYMDAHYNLGVVYFLRGSWREAEAEFQTVISLAPLHPRAYSGLGFVYSRTGDLVGAEKAFRTALSIQPSDINARLALAKLYANQGRREEAAGEYQAILATDPDNWKAQSELKGLGALPSNPRPLR